MYQRIILLALLAITACQTDMEKKSKILYKNKAYTLYADRVVQGDNEAIVVSPTHIKSNYKSPASASYSRLIPFKFSINEKDNELAPGNDHWLIIGDEHQSPVITFGEKPAPRPDDPGTHLPTNYEYTFRVDMSPVLKQFEKQGYYEAYDGSKVAAADFKGFYIAGASEPLTWDFVNLGNQGLKLQPVEEGSSIYSITLNLNPYDPADYEAKRWKLSLDLTDKPSYSSEQPIVDALFNLSLEEALKNIEADSTLRTGAKWGGVWTRDISYSIYLAFAYHEPEIAKISLLKKVKRDRIIQDTGSGGAWPVSSDRTVWSIAAWEIYKITGDEDWLNQAYTIIKNTLDDDYKTIDQTESGLYRGESSFLDWREQTYPKWMDNTDIYVSENLGTNVVHYQAHRILGKMAKALGKPYATYEQRAATIKKAINEKLWMENPGYYAQYRYGRPYLTTSPRFEALGEALAILFDVADEEKAKTIISQSPVTTFGTTCIYPQIPNIPPYHNNGIWPFVQAYWNLAAAKAGNEAALNHGLGAIYRAGALFLTNYENMVATTGDFMGTEINSDRMLWSMAGNLAMVHRLFMGMSFKVDGIAFNPVIPENYAGKRVLKNFHYREARLDITVSGYGNEIASIALDDQKLNHAFIPADLKGRHTIVIKMANKPFIEKEINLQANHFSLPTPRAKQNGDRLLWEAIKGSTGYNVYKNGKLLKTTNDVSLKADMTETATYKVSVIDSIGYESFTSEPILMTNPKNIQQVEIEKFEAAADLPYTNYSGDGFVEISNQNNKTITLKVNVEEAGSYRLDFRYSNGSGPWNTENKCAIRSLYINDEYVGAQVFPQRGTDEWSDWGWSNAQLVNLKAGKNTLQLTFEPWNINMNVDVNKAMLDYLRVVKL